MLPTRFLHFFAASCGGTETSIIDCSNAVNGVWNILILVINILAVGVGIVAIGGIIYGAILWTTAQDNAGQITKSKAAIANTVIGLVLFAGLYSLTQYLIPGGVFNRDFSAPVATNPSNDSSGSNSGGNSNNNGDKKNENNKKVDIRIGVYNAQSVDKTSASQLSRFKTGWSKIKDLTDIVVVAEFSTTHYEYISNFSNWTAYYPAGARGDRGKAILYRNDKFTASNRGSVSIPLISTTGKSTSNSEPTITLTRKKDKAKISIMAVHLAAKNGNAARWKTNQKNQQPIVGKWLSGNEKETRIAAGDFNWYLPGYTSNLTGVATKLTGERVMRIMIPKNQTFGDYYTSINLGSSITDHPQIIADIKTAWFDK